MAAVARDVYRTHDAISGGKYIDSSTALEYKFEILVCYLSISEADILQYFLLHYYLKTIMTTQMKILLYDLIKYDAFLQINQPNST